MKTYLALSVQLSKVEDRFRGNNGSCQFTIVCRANNMREVLNILNSSGANCSYHHLTKFCGIHKDESWADICKKDNTIYYHVQGTKSGWYDKWFEYSPP